MIVSINKNNSDSYVNLFTDAYRFLKAIDESQGTSYVDPNQERFGSLAEYYGHMADLFDTFAYQYVMMPLDEEPCHIDLNSREIKVPAAFSRCASVQNDLLAETIIFTVDRYFDYMDLATTEIFVQWITPGPNGVHGATRVEMIDRSNGDKLKFAWPLHDEITKTPGDVKFSIRFFRLDKESDEVVYSLNTSDAKITIKPALQPEGPNIVEKPVGDNAFKRAIVNSYYSNEGIPQPETPSFQAPGSDITINPEDLEILKEADSNVINGVKVVGLKDNTVTLYAQAIVPDTGEIRYEWYFQPVGSEVAYPCNKFPAEDGETITLGVQEDDYFEVSEAEKATKVLGLRYCTKEGNAYPPYTGTFPATVPLYTRFTTYTVAPGDVDITGTYHVRAYNEIIKPNKEVVSSIRYGASCDCLLPPPKEVKITSDLEDAMILNAANEAPLSFAIAVDEYNPSIVYEWRMSGTDKEAVLDIENTAATTTTTEPILTATAPGWYTGRAVATLNRKVKDALTKRCKVTNKPEPPVVAYQGNEMLTAGANPAVLTVEASIANPNKIADELLSDAITYIWQTRPINAMSNSDWVTVDDAVDVGISGQGTNTLTVTKDMAYAGANFRCLVINELNGKKALFDHSGKYVNSINPDLGEFKNEPPYIFADDKAYTYTVLRDE